MTMLRFVLIATLFFVTSTANATVLFFEDFEGTPGETLTDLGWGGSGGNIILDDTTTVVSGNSGKIVGSGSYFSTTFDFSDITSLGAVGNQLIASGTLLTNATYPAGKFLRFINLGNVGDGSGSSIYPAWEFGRTDIKGQGGTGSAPGGFPDPPVLFEPELLTDTLYDFRNIYTEGGPGATDDTFQKEYKLSSSGTWIDVGSSSGTFKAKDSWVIDSDLDVMMHIDNLKLELVTLTPGSELDAIWTNDGTGSWTDAENWDTISAPATKDHSVTFGNIISAPTTAVVDTDLTINSITFDHSTSYAAGGLGSLNLETNSVSTPVISVMQGNHQFLVVTNLLDNTTVDVASNSTVAFIHALNLSGNTLTKTGPGTMSVNDNLSLMSGGSLNIQQGTVVGVGTVGGDLNNDSGTIAPGNIAGQAGGAMAVGQVPEPTTYVVLLLGLATVGMFVRCDKRYGTRGFR